MQKESTLKLKASGSGSKVKPEDKHIARASRSLSGLGKNLSKQSKAKKGVSGRGLGKGPTVSMPSMQKSVVKIKFAKNMSAGSWKQHGYYVEREGAQLEGGKGVGFGSQGDEQSVAHTLDKWQKAEDKQVFKLIISPEFGERLDLREHAKKLIVQMEKDLGTKLEWVGIDHHNTDNPHLHLLVRGRDDQGKELVISPDYIKSGARLRSQEIVTNELGYRTGRDAAIARERQIAQHRYTGIDRTLEYKIEQGGKGREISFAIPTSKPLNDEQYEKRMAEIRRCAELEKLGLAKRTGPLTFLLDADLQRKLREIAVVEGRELIVAKNRNRFSDPTIPIAHTDLKNLGDGLTGKLIGVGIDPNSEREYMLIEGVDGRAHFVTPNSKLMNLRGADDAEKRLKDGMIVSLNVAQFTDKEGKVVKYMDVATADTLTDEIAKRAANQPHPDMRFEPRPGSFADKYKQKLDQMQLQQINESVIKMPTKQQKQWGKKQNQNID